MAFDGPVPCEPYITHDDLAICCDVDPVADPATTLRSRQIASSFLFYATGQQYPGCCPITIRPCWECAPCGQLPVSPYGSYKIGRPYNPQLIDGRWYNVRCTENCYCNDNCTFTLSNWDVSEVTAVWIEGVEVTDFQLVDHGKLLVMPDGTCFPECNDLSRPAIPGDPMADYSDTWAISFTQGSNPPDLLLQAASDLACHYQTLCGDNCNTCQFGIVALQDMENLPRALQDRLPWVMTGIPSVDLAIQILNPKGYPRARARIYTPEAAEYVTEY